MLPEKPLHFVRTPENVKEAQALLGGSTEIISKIETIDAVEHINFYIYIQ